MRFASDGNLVDDYADVLKRGAHLAVMPVARLYLEGEALSFPQGITFYPEGTVLTEKLGINYDVDNLADFQSSAAGITEETLTNHSLVVFPVLFEWENFRHNSNKTNMSMILKLSDHVDRCCFNLIRYLQCPIFSEGDPIHSLPARAGQIITNHMMSGALLYNHSLRQSRIIAGDAFTHMITRGVGLPIEDVDEENFPRDGEVGSLVNHALFLYTSMLESNNPTSFFIQALGLLEFLAFPDEFKPFQEVKKVIARYKAKNQAEYVILLDRFLELTGKQVNGEFTGYRTRVIHLGQRIEDIIDDEKEVRHLFCELDGYIRAVIDHMINHSEKKYSEYLAVRGTMCAYKQS